MKKTPQIAAVHRVVGRKPQAAAVFIDMLGFAGLIEDDDAAVDYLDSFRGPDRDGPLSTLETRFLAFHSILDASIERKLQNRDLRMVVFSDSAFIIFEEDEYGQGLALVGHALSFAKRLIRSMLANHIPVRVGIGFGSYRNLRFKSDGDPGRGISVHSAQFLGTAIVQAHRAESCGLPGMRIFIHPSISVENEELRDLRDRFLEVDGDSGQLKTPVIHELIYLHKPGDEGWWGWNDKPVKPEVSNDELIRSIHEMQLIAPAGEARHYLETLRSLERGRRQLRVRRFVQPAPTQSATANGRLPSRWRRMRRRQS
jgi:hypothetical protein